MTFVIKNTFLDLVDAGAEPSPVGATRRSSSVPKDCRLTVRGEDSFSEDPFGILGDNVHEASDDGIRSTSARKAKHYKHSGSASTCSSSDSEATPTTLSDNEMLTSEDDMHSCVSDQAAVDDEVFSAASLSENEREEVRKVEQQATALAVNLAQVASPPSPQGSPQRPARKRWADEDLDGQIAEEAQDANASQVVEEPEKAKAEDQEKNTVLSWTEWAAKVPLPPLPVERRPLRAKRLGCATLGINALDLVMPRSHKKAPTKVASKIAPVASEEPDASTHAGSANHEDSSEKCTDIVTECAVLEAEEAYFHDDDDLSPVPRQAKIHIQLDVLCEDAPPVPAVVTKLNPTAATFMPASCGIGEAAMLIAAAQMALNSCAQIFAVERCEGTLGTITTLSAQVADGPAPSAMVAQSALEAAKAALLATAALSQSVYIIGYLTECPFEDFEEGTGFAASLGFVRRDQEDTACWDTFQKGFCPRRSTCRWCHPAESDLVRVHVVLK